jgi:hypothetical protein
VLGELMINDDGAATNCTDNTRNWVRNITYGENGAVTADNIVYSDLLGRATQFQQKILSRGEVLAARTVFDKWGRGALQTLPAPALQSELCYRDRFITNAAGNNYSAQDFDTESTLNSPAAVGSSSPLGTYYSANNSSEPYVAASQFPYVRTEYFPDPLCRVKRTAAAGKDHRMGSGHEKRYFYLGSGG